jgi:transcriptional regulator with XRE-family HTH domain
MAGVSRTSSASVADPSAHIPPTLAAALVSAARRDSGLSQRELSRRAGVSRTTVVEIESGARDPGVDTLRAVLRGAGMDLDVRLAPCDKHDEVLQESLRALPARERERLESSFERYVDALAVGLATSRPLIDPP